MNKAHQIKLYPTKSQEILLRKSCGVARYSFNWALNRWNELYKLGEKTSAYSLIKFQNSIKKEQMPFFKEVTKNAPQYAIHDVESAFKNYFRNLKDGTIEKQKKSYVKNRKSKGLPIIEGKLHNIGKPNFKKKGIHDSFVAVENKATFKQSDFKISLPRIGEIKCAENLRFEGKVNNVVVKRIANMWFAVINIEVLKPVEILVVGENQATIGIDMGIKRMMTLSDGTIYENPKALKSNLKGLKRLQRGLSRKVKGSNNRIRQQMRVANKYYRVSNIRKNAIHKATSEIVVKYSRIVIEDLNVKGMMKNHKLAQALGDISFGEISRQLAYKANWQGKELVKADTFFASSKICSCCGHKKETLKLSDRIYNCDVCGLSIDRDLNASINLANYSSTSKLEGCKACGEVVEGTQSESKKHEVTKLINMSLTAQ